MPEGDMLDGISLCPAIPSATSVRYPSVLVYLITGNPGVVSYYSAFLTSLFEYLQAGTNRSKAVHVAASSLPGFEVLRPSRQEPHDPPYNLRETINLVRGDIETAVHHIKREAESPLKDVPVILIGHSVGSYILLEVLAAFRTSKQGPNAGSFDIIAGICLFPTIVDLAKSPMGLKLAPIAKLPFLPQTLQLLASVFFKWMPLALVSRIVTAINGMPEAAATTTARFLQSRNGVRQALYLARHELEEMTHDKWGEEVWGDMASTLQTSSSSSSRTPDPTTPKLYFYWGENDRWVANTTRDTVIAARGNIVVNSEETENRRLHHPVKMEMDRLGTPHDFCIRHSRPIAGKVAEYIEEILLSLDADL